MGQQWHGAPFLLDISVYVFDYLSTSYTDKSVYTQYT